MYFCKGQYPSVNVPKCWMQLSWCAWWESLPKMKRGRAVPREQRAQSHWGWSVHLCLYFDLLKHLITSFPFTSITSADPKPALVWWAAASDKISTKSFPSSSFHSAILPFPRHCVETWKGCWCFGESPPPLSLPLKPGLISSTVTVLDLCVFSPHWSASERKWEGGCESHFKHLLRPWSIPKPSYRSSGGNVGQCRRKRMKRRRRSVVCTGSGVLDSNEAWWVMATCR